MAAFARTAVEGDDYAMLAAEFPDSSFQLIPGHDGRTRTYMCALQGADFRLGR